MSEKADKFTTRIKIYFGILPKHHLQKGELKILKEELQKAKPIFFLVVSCQI